MTNQNVLRGLMITALVAAGMPIIVAQERVASLPEGEYPCRILFAVAMVNTGTEEAPVYRQFTSWDGFHLNPERTAVDVIFDEYKPKSKFAEPTAQIGIFYQVIGGKYSVSGAHSPARFNLSGYKKREDLSEEEFIAGGYEIVEGYLAVRDTDGLLYRVPDPAKSKTGQGILASTLGAIFGDAKNEDGSPFDQIDLQLQVEDGNDLTCNVIMKKDLKDPEKRIVPMFVNRYNSERCTHPVVEELETVDASDMPPQ